MILSGRTAITRALLTNLKDPALQVQPCSIDLSLKSILNWKEGGVLDFSNEKRKTPTTEKLPFQASPNDSSPCVKLQPGSYMVEFAERVALPTDVMCHFYPRSTLFRSGALIHAGVCDAGYSGALGGVLQIVNPHGVTLYEGARIAQIVFHETDGNGGAYSGKYQGTASMG